MITLIAESKKMSTELNLVSSGNMARNKPHFQNEADIIIRLISEMTNEEIAERVKISPLHVSKVRKLLYDFPNRSTGLSSIFAFTGEVFRAIDVSRLSTDELKFAKKHISILSSLYGLLHTSDIIKPYRLDFNTDCTAEIGTLNKFWKTKITSYLMESLDKSGENEILNLLPADASKCIDWNIIKNNAKILKPEFKVVAESGDLKTPHSGKIKELRGKMVKHILIERINSFHDLLNHEFPDFRPCLIKYDRAQGGLFLRKFLSSP